MADQTLEEKFASLAEYQKETARQLRELGRKIGSVDGKFGSFTEAMALPSMSKILRQRFQMDTVLPRACSEIDGRELEIDVLALSRSVDEVYIVEVKSHLRQEGIDQIKETLRQFHDFFPGHRGKKVYGILAAVDIPSQVREKVLREGIYLARIHDEEFELRVPAGFKARAF
jgi:hypothetical protein